MLARLISHFLSGNRLQAAILTERTSVGGVLCLLCDTRLDGFSRFLAKVERELRKIENIVSGWWMYRMFVDVFSYAITQAVIKWENCDWYDSKTFCSTRRTSQLFSELYTVNKVSTSPKTKTKKTRKKITEFVITTPFCISSWCFASSLVCSCWRFLPDLKRIAKYFPPFSDFPCFSFEAGENLVNSFVWTHSDSGRTLSLLQAGWGSNWRLASDRIRGVIGIYPKLTETVV